MHCTASSNPHLLTVNTQFLHLIYWKWFKRAPHGQLLLFKCLHVWRRQLEMTHGINCSYWEP